MDVPSFDVSLVSSCLSVLWTDIVCLFSWIFSKQSYSICLGNNLYFLELYTYISYRIFGKPPFKFRPLEISLLFTYQIHLISTEHGVITANPVRVQSVVLQAVVAKEVGMGNRMIGKYFL